MKLFDFKKNINVNELEECIKCLNEGNLVIFPTETVYGIGANVYNENAINNIFEAKKRYKDNPLIVHVSDFNMLKKCVKEISPLEKKLIDAFMPGPFTLILPKSDDIPYAATANLDTVGIRMPNNKIANALIQACNFPIAAPSANLSTKPSGTNVEDIYDEFESTVSIMIDGGSTDIGVESTVLKVIDGMPTILRPGRITKEDVIDVVGICKYSENINELKTGTVESPGLKYKHYAPTTPSILIYNEDNNKLLELIKKNMTDNTVVIGCEENKKYFNNYLSYGRKDDYLCISHNIFSLLRKADKLNKNLIIIEGVKKDGFGLSIMNRLMKSCSHHYIDN